MNPTRPGTSVLFGLLFIQTLLIGLLIQPKAIRAGVHTSTSGDQLELRARWSAWSGPFGTGGKLILRRLDEERVSLMLSLPDRLWLPNRQYILREQEALLHWQDPESARSLMEPDGTLVRILSELPPTGPLALLTGQGLEPMMTQTSRDDCAGWSTLQGTLAGYPAELRQGRNAALTLDWHLPEGSYHFHWREGSVGHNLILVAPQGYKVRIFSRLRRHAQVSLEDWLFLAE